MSEILSVRHRHNGQCCDTLSIYVAPLGPTEPIQPRASSHLNWRNYNQSFATRDLFGLVMVWCWGMAMSPAWKFVYVLSCVSSACALDSMGSRLMMALGLSMLYPYSDPSCSQPCIPPCWNQILKKSNPWFGSDISFSILQLLVECAGLCLLVRQTVVLTGLHSGHRVLPRLEGVEHQLVRAGLGGQHHLQLHG